MRVVKKHLLLAVLLILYIAAISLLLRSFYMYQMAYQNLSRLISHPTVETVYDKTE